MSPTRYHCATPLHSLNLWRPHEDSNPELLITKQAFYRLNYGAPNMVEMVGIEPTRFCLQNRCSPNVSYIPTTSLLVGRQGLEPCLALYKNAVLTHTPTPVHIWSGTIESNDALSIIRRSVTTSHPMPEQSW